MRLLPIAILLVACSANTVVTPEDCPDIPDPEGGATVEPPICNGTPEQTECCNLGHWAVCEKLPNGCSSHEQCSESQYCEFVSVEQGLCTKRKIWGEACEDDRWCSIGLACGGGVCVAECSIGDG